MPDGQEYCSEHSGCTVSIESMKHTLSDHEKRLRDIEKTVWKASGLTGAIVLAGQWIIQHYVGK